MSQSMRDPDADGHLSRLETVRPCMAKADLKDLEAQWRQRIGKAIARCFKLADVTQKEGAALLDRDQGQIARWMSGAEAQPLNAIFAVDRLRQPMVIALAELAGTDVVTTITVRRIA